MVLWPRTSRWDLTSPLAVQALEGRLAALLSSREYFTVRPFEGTIAEHRFRIRSRALWLRKNSRTELLGEIEPASAGTVVRLTIQPPLFAYVALLAMVGGFVVQASVVIARWLRGVENPGTAWRALLAFAALYAAIAIAYWHSGRSARARLCRELEATEVPRVLSPP
jgi:hypothetical protein